MALDDLKDNVEQEVDEKEVEKLSEKLGVEDKEELKKLDDRITSLYELVIMLDSKVEELRDRMGTVERAIGREDREDDVELPWEEDELF